MQPCPFCAIDPNISRVIQEHGTVRVMLSNPRLTPGHLLVMPTKHVEMPWELEPHELRELYAYVVYYQKKVIDLKLTPNCDVRQHYRPSVPQGPTKVNHLHFHILPREPMEAQELYRFSTDALAYLPLRTAEMDKYAALYRGG